MGVVTSKLYGDRFALHRWPQEHHLLYAKGNGRGYIMNDSGKEWVVVFPKNSLHDCYSPKSSLVCLRRRKKVANLYKET